jgi:hypothetical protein
VEIHSADGMQLITIVWPRKKKTRGFSNGSARTQGASRILRGLASDVTTAALEDV